MADQIPYEISLETIKRKSTLAELCAEDVGRVIDAFGFEPGVRFLITELEALITEIRTDLQQVGIEGQR